MYWHHNISLAIRVAPVAVDTAVSSVAFRFTVISRPGLCGGVVGTTDGSKGAVHEW